MKKIFLSGLLVAFGFTLSFASQNSASPLIKKNIDNLLNNFGENINIGIFVKDAKTGEILYQRDIDRYFMPASNQKIFTAYAALKFLGPDFRYRTQLFVDKNKLENGILKDNLYLQFSGDPTLTVDQLEQLVNTLSKAGIKQIQGKIVIDDTAFDRVFMSPGKSWDDQDFCWGSPVSAITLNHNCANVTIVPTTAGVLANIQLPDYPQSMQFINQVTTRSAKAKNCVLKVVRANNNTYTVSGCIKEKSKAHPIEMSISSPRKNLKLILNFLLNKKHIQVSPNLDFRKFALTQEPIAYSESKPLKELVSKMLKDSDNTIADALFKTIGGFYTHQTGSFINGNKAVREILSKYAQLSIPKTALIDGAGGSRYNFVTPEQIVKLLENILASPLGADFVGYLAISGVDGTLKDRLKSPATLGKIYAKTGSETAVTSLSGYLETKNKRILIFSIMINGFTNPSTKYKTLEDKLCQAMVEAG